MDREHSVYVIRIRGHLGATSLAAFPALTSRQQGEDTVLTGVLLDRSALFGVLAEVEALGLELIELNRVVPSRESPDSRKAHSP